MTEYVITSYCPDGSPEAVVETPAEVIDALAAPVALFSTLSTPVAVTTSVGYITVADVDALLGAGWQGQGDASRAVRMANAWLRERIKVVLPTTIPSEVIEAGAEIAREAAAGKLYAATGREVTSTDVSAAPGTYAKATYASGSVARSAGETYALALIAPWMRRSSTIFLERS